MYMLMDIFRFSMNEQVRHMFDEIDYVLEGRNAERFASLYGYTSPCKFSFTCSYWSVMVSIGSYNSAIYACSFTFMS